MLDHGIEQQTYMNLKFANGSEACSGSGSGIGIGGGYSAGTGSGTSGSGLPSARSQSNLSQFRSDFYAPLSVISHPSTFNAELLRNANQNAAPVHGIPSGLYARSDYAGSRCSYLKILIVFYSSRFIFLYYTLKIKKYDFWVHSSDKSI